jgi:hypothetical protein
MRSRRRKGEVRAERLKKGRIDERMVDGWMMGILQRQPDGVHSEYRQCIWGLDEERGLQRGNREGTAWKDKM